MRIYVIPADKHGCGHYRMLWPAEVLKKQGHDIEIVPPKQGSGFLAKTMMGPNGEEILTSIQMPADMDVVVIQRPCHPLQPQMIRALRQNGVAVVVDMDDDMSNIHPRNAAYHLYNPRSSSPFSWKYAADSCREATLVTTTSVALQRVYAKHGRGMIINNYVPKAFLHFPKPETGAFGWAGNTRSHPDDLQVLGKTVTKLISEGSQFRVVGGDKGVRPALKLDHDPIMTGDTSVYDWVRIIAETFDVGMVPLSATAFNASKSRLKGIEMFSVGIPWVASPRAEYRTLVKEAGCGLLAETPKEWYTQLKRLLTDQVLCKEQAEAGREYMAGQTYEENAWRWLNAWEEAYRIEHPVKAP